MLKTLTAAGFIAAASLLASGVAQAETTGGTTMGGGDNGQRLAGRHCGAGAEHREAERRDARQQELLTPRRGLPVRVAPLRRCILGSGTPAIVARRAKRRKDTEAALDGWVRSHAFREAGGSQSSAPQASRGGLAGKRGRLRAGPSPEPPYSTLAPSGLSAASRPCSIGASAICTAPATPKTDVLAVSSPVRRR